MDQVIDENLNVSFETSGITLNFESANSSTLDPSEFQKTKKN